MYWSKIILSVTLLGLVFLPLELLSVYCNNRKSFIVNPLMQDDTLWLSQVI